MQADEFARNFNLPLTDLSDPVIIQVLLLDSPVIVVLVRNIMARSGEGISTHTSAGLAGLVPSPWFVLQDQIHLLHLCHQVVKWSNH